MREVKVLVTLRVDECHPNVEIGQYPMQAAVVEAIENAVRHAESNGFSHKRADELSISFVDAVAC